MKRLMGWLIFNQNIKVTTMIEKDFRPSTLNQAIKLFDYGHLINNYNTLGK